MHIEQIKCLQFRIDFLTNSKIQSLDVDNKLILINHPSGVILSRELAEDIRNALIEIRKDKKSKSILIFTNESQIISI